MVDEVNILNVGGKDGVASEVTLKNLQSAVENLAGKKGLDPKEANKGLTDLKKGLGQSNKQIKEEFEARGENTDALDDHTDALGKAGRGLMNFGGAIIGSGVASVKGMSDALISGSNNLSDFSEHIPIVGGALSMLTGVMDNSVNTFQSMSKSGAAFDYDLGQMRSTAAQAGLSLEQFSGMISENSEKFAAFGGTVTQGARRTSQLVVSLGEQREQLMAMGLTFEDISEQMQFYQYVNRAGSRADTRTRAEQAEAAASLTKNFLTLSKITGKDIESQQQALAQEQQTFAFQAQKSKMDKDNAAAVDQGMSQVMAMFGESSGAMDYFKAQILGMPPMTEAGRAFAASMPDAARQITDLANSATQSGMTAQKLNENMGERMARMLQSAVASGEDFETALKAQAAGMEGLPAGFAENFNEMAMQSGKYMKDGEFLFEKAARDFQKAADAAIPEDGELEGMAAFREGLRLTRSSLTDNLLNPLMTTLAPSVESFGDMLQEVVESKGFKNFMNTMKEKIEDFKVFFGKFIDRFKEDPQEALKELFENHIGPFFKDMTGKLTGLIGDGIKAGITSLFTSPTVLAAMTAGIAVMFAKSKIAGGVGRGVGGMVGGAGKGLGKLAGTLGKMVKGGGLLGLGGLAVGAIGDKADEAGYEKTGTALDVGGTALTGAGLGAAIGSVVPVLGTAVGGAVGGALGGAYGLAKNFMFGGDDESAQEATETSQQSSQQKMQDVAAARQAATVSDEQMQRLEKLVGFAPQVNTLSQNIVGFNDQFNNMQLSYQEIDRATLSLEKMAEQLEEINNQLDGDKSFFDKMNPFSGLGDKTAGDVLSQSGSGSSEQMEQLNRTMKDILAVLLTSKDMNKKQLGAARAMSGNLYQGF